HTDLHTFPTRRSSDLSSGHRRGGHGPGAHREGGGTAPAQGIQGPGVPCARGIAAGTGRGRSPEAGPLVSTVHGAPPTAPLTPVGEPRRTQGQDSLSQGLKRYRRLTRTNGNPLPPPLGARTRTHRAGAALFGGGLRIRRCR